MNQQETNKALLLLAAQGDPEKAREIEQYLDLPKYPAGGVVVTEVKQPGLTGEAVRAAIRHNEAVQIPDGIYLVLNDGKAIKTYKPGEVTEDDKARCTGVAVKLGEKSICVDLYNMADGEEITLTNREDKTDWDGYKDNALDAGADWDGEGNTKHLLNVGLNPKIVLDRGQFIPSVAQWRFICLFRKELNQALAEVGGDELTGWYWTSTEYSATNAWRLYLRNGFMSYGTKASNRDRVRAVSAFII